MEDKLFIRDHEIVESTILRTRRYKSSKKKTRDFKESDFNKFKQLAGQASWEDNQKAKGMQDSR